MKGAVGILTLKHANLRLEKLLLGVGTTTSWKFCSRYQSQKMVYFGWHCGRVLSPCWHLPLICCSHPILGAGQSTCCPKLVRLKASISIHNFLGGSLLLFGQEFTSKLAGEWICHILHAGLPMTVPNELCIFNWHLYSNSVMMMINVKIKSDLSHSLSNFSYHLTYMCAMCLLIF